MKSNFSFKTSVYDFGSHYKISNENENFNRSCNLLFIRIYLKYLKSRKKTSSIVILKKTCSELNKK